ncbi:efflux transporter outer membrane subunit [Thalassospira sp.]|uniref:efflux transporter outer membrane subunit n=1 Tax=Thalassospira sp. TaxID=1912094 RepID=UPI0027361CFF|nr:efflux transporter outer membrane subunit [Thalassospira sp.]MDP2700358.1 efflux transporter outer membrane subunit [Thalassospira sp.]
MFKNMLKSGTILMTITLTITLAACSSLSTVDYTPPETSIPTGWHGETAPDTAGVAMVASSDWWSNFNDPVLNSLIADALSRNNDLAAATIKVRRAQLTAGLAEDAFYPDLSAGSTASLERELDGARSSSRNFGANATVSYELDLWGKLGHDYDAAKWEALATLEDRESTALSLTATTATLYWQIIYDRQRLDIANASIAYARQTLALVDVQYESGSSSALEVFEARQNLDSQLADYTLIEQSLRENTNALSILFDQPPQEMAVARATLPENALPEIAAGLPAQLLGRRPDIRAAELRLRENVAELNAVKTGLLPTISLTGELGSSSDQLRSLLQNPLGTLGASLALPFLNWNEGQLDIKISESDYQQAIVEYRQTLYQALADVENALSARTQYDRQSVNLEAALDAAQNAERIYETRFRAGAVSMQSWLDAQETRRTAEESLLANKRDRIINLITLYQALGGNADARPTAEG